jgi:hypothetical protein
MNLEPVMYLPASCDRVVFSGQSGETRQRYIAQSILYGIVDNPEPPSLEEARDIIAWASKKPVF